MIVATPYLIVWLTAFSIHSVTGHLYFWSWLGKDKILLYGKHSKLLSQHQKHPWALLGLLPETCCFFLLPVCCLGPAVLLLFSPCSFALDHQDGMQQDCCWILVVTIPALHNSFVKQKEFSIARLSFPITLTHHSACLPLPHLPD